MLSAIKKRPLKRVGVDIWTAVSVLEEHYGGVLTHDSGHGKNTDEQATTWIFTFPRHGDAQIAVPMNKRKLAFLMRDRTVDGKALEPLIERISTVEQRYIDSERGVASSVLGSRAPFLNPSSSNPLLRVALDVGKVADVVAIYLANVAGAKKATTANKLNSEPDSSDVPSHRQQLSEEEFANQLERNSEVGKAGELYAVQDELERLRECGCSDPERYVSRVALSDVGRGYDIESTWPGQERCIEVKSSIQFDSDFFLTQNERQVLSTLGTRAWLYRVWLRVNGEGPALVRVNNPIAQIGTDQMMPVVWRVSHSALKDCA